ncbi:MAG TPA: SpoIIE family protein phosphatase [Candidatus Elarobacter sp.]|jgi:PAS domain S-box-containing protein
MRSPERIPIEGLPPVDLATLDVLPDPAWVTTPAERFAYFNAAWLGLIGSGERYADKDTFYERLHPDDRAVLKDAWETAREQKAPFAVDCRIRLRDGDHHWFLLRAIPVGEAWLGTAIDVDAERRAREALIAAESRARTIADAMPQLTGITDAAGRVLWVNDKHVAYTGQPSDEVLGEGWTTIVHPEDVLPMLDGWRNALASGEPFETQYRLRRFDGAYRWFLNRSVPVRDGNGKITSWIGTATDIDARKRAEDALRIVVEASLAFSETLDAAVALQRLADVVAAHVADWCGVSIFDAAGRLQPVAIAHRDPSRVRVIKDYMRRYPSRDDDAGTIVATTGIPVRIDPIVPEMYDAIDDPAQRAEAKALALRAILYVPLGDKTEPLGVLSLALSETDRSFTDEDQQLATLIAQRASIAVANARLYERQSQVARTLQSAFLPPALPRTDGIAFDAIYTAGTRDLTIGGDWYDAFALENGTIAFSVGDVAGRGLDAAVPMGKMRQTFRALGAVDADPTWSLSVADAVLRREHPDIFVTAFVATFDPHAGLLTHANAGHPAPFLREADGTLTRIEAPGVPLGLGALAEQRNEERTLHSGDLLVAFTDGLIETTRDIAEGEERVASALAHPAFAICSEPAALLSALIVPDEPGDDIAILALRVGRGADWTFDAARPRRAQAARGAFVRRLVEAGVGERARDACETIFGELIGNVARYTPGPVDVALRRSDGRFRLAALDRGPGFRWDEHLPADQFAESGRGLFIIGRLGSAVRAEYLPGFGSYIELTLPT